MREIMFKVWDKEKKQMYYWNPYMCEGSIKEHMVLLQYTGLKDKNGKEIYEGDIVCIDCEKKGNVEFIEGQFVVRFHNEESLASVMYYLAYYEFEVIGNIYENLELLEGDNK